MPGPAELAKRHDGEKVWGYKRVHCAEIDLQARGLDSEVGRAPADGHAPRQLDWLLPDSVRSYNEVGNPRNSAQVNPYMFTKPIARLAEEHGTKIIIGSATTINHKDDEQKIKSVTYVENGTARTLAATDVVIAAGPWTPRIFPKAQLRAPRGHSVVVRPSRDLSPYVLLQTSSRTQSLLTKRDFRQRYTLGLATIFTNLTQSTLLDLMTTMFRYQPLVMG